MFDDVSYSGQGATMVHAKLQELALGFAAEILQLVRRAPLAELAEASGDAPPRVTASRTVPPVSRRAVKRSPKRAKPAVKVEGKKRVAEKRAKAAVKPERKKRVAKKPAEKAEASKDAALPALPTPHGVLSMLPKAPKCLSAKKIAAKLAVAIDHVGTIMGPHVETGSVVWTPGPKGGYALSA
jgi:hypothetical protein